MCLVDSVWLELKRMGMRWDVSQDERGWVDGEHMGRRTEISDVQCAESITGWWARATPLKNMSSSIGMISNRKYMGKCRKWQPNHQPVMNDDGDLGANAKSWRTFNLNVSSNATCWKLTGSMYVHVAKSCGTGTQICARFIMFIYFPRVGKEVVVECFETIRRTVSKSHGCREFLQVHPDFDPYAASTTQLVQRFPQGLPGWLNRIQHDFEVRIGVDCTACFLLGGIPSGVQDAEPPSSDVWPVWLVRSTGFRSCSNRTPSALIMTWPSDEGCWGNPVPKVGISLRVPVKAAGEPIRMSLPQTQKLGKIQS